MVVVEGQAAQTRPLRAQLVHLELVLCTQGWCVAQMARVSKARCQGGLFDTRAGRMP